MASYMCGAGWIDDSCEWSGPLAEMAVLEHIPEHLRDGRLVPSPDSGVYPCAVRAAVCPRCAAHLAKESWNRIVDADPDRYAEVCSVAGVE
jgi:hypothetical protein